MSKMNPDIKARWVAALRSGEYKQATDTLRSKSGGFCCLGVLCDLFAQEAGESWNVRRLSELDGPVIGGAYKSPDKGMPGARVAIWSGVDWERDVRIGNQRAPLYVHNDNGRTFAEIADAIEAQL